MALRRIDLREAATTNLRELILDGTFVPGQRLVETELAERFGTSRGPVRDALTELEHVGLVEVAPRGGSFVATFSADDVDEIYSLRLSLEELAVRRAARRATPDDTRAMGAALGRLSVALEAGDVQAAAENDLRFHRVIVQTAGHGRLESAWDRVADQILLVLRELPDIGPEIQSATGMHQEILSAIRLGDEEVAAAAIRGHLESARQTLVDQRRTVTPGV